MRRIAGATLLALLAISVAAAPAATPTKGASYQGETRNGDSVALKVGKSGKRVTFSITCDSGGQAVKVRGMAVSESGEFSGSKRQSGRVILRVTGEFVSKRRATGTKSGVVCFSGTKSFSASRQD